MPRTHAILTALTIPLLLTACDTTRVNVVDVDAQTKGYHIACDSTPPFSSYKDCTQRAAQICGSDGYTILKKDDSVVGGSASYFSVSTREILVKCDGPAVYTPDNYAAPQ